MSVKNSLNRTCCYCLCWVVGISTILAHQVAYAQPPAIPPGLQNRFGNDTGDEDAAEQRLAIDRKTTQTLNSFRKQLEEGNLDRAIDNFRTLRTADPLSLVPSAQESVFVPLYKAVFAASCRLPESERKKLETTDSARSAGLLTTAISESGAKTLPSIILRSAGTQAAIDAHFVAAQLHLSRGNHFAAKSWLQPLTHEGLPQEVRNTSSAMLSSIPSISTAQPTNKTNKSAELPKHLVWQSRTASSPRLKKQIAIFLKAAELASVIPQSSWNGIVDDSLIYRRSFRGLAAIDKETGSTKWEYPLQESLDKLITADRTNNSIFSRTKQPSLSSSTFATIEQSPLVNAFCRDNSIGRIASDSERLYLAVSTNKSLSATRPSGFFPLVNSNSSSSLIAIEKKTGRRIWTLGTATLKEQLGDSDSGEWFAGPPHPTGRHLLSVFEYNGEMLLGCIEATTGELLWTASLVFPQQSIDKDRVRRYWGATPSQHAGMIWCPTTAGWLVCVDELTQSIAYASQIQSDGPNQPQATFRRNQVIALTRTASVSDRWSVPKVIPTGDRLAVIANESRSIHLMEATTGRLIDKVNVQRGETLLHVDSKRIVLASSKVIRSLATSNGSTNWSQQLTADTGYPIGKATLQGDSLLVPLNTGAIARCSLTTGEFAQTSPVVFPANSWGRLVSASTSDNDLLLLSPDRALRLSSTPVESTPGSPLEIALGLLTTGNPQAALQQASTISKTSDEFAEAQSVIFESRLRLATADPDQHLEALKNSQLSLEELMQVQVFDAAISFNRGDLSQTVFSLIEILDSDQLLLRVDIPAIANVWESATTESSPQASAVPQTQRTVKTWAAGKLSGVLSDMPDSQSIAPNLERLQDTTLLAIEHPAVVPLLHDRMQATKSLEFWWHAMFHCVSLKANISSDELTDELQLASNKVDQIIQDDRLTQAARILLADSLINLSPQFTEIAERLSPSLATQLEEQANRLATKFQKWNAEIYNVVPVNRLTSYSNTMVRVGRSVIDDNVLAPYNWKVIRSSFGRLQARDIADPTNQWSIPGSFQVNGMYSTATDLLQRQESVVVLNASQKMTAVSLLDQRITWEKSGTGRMSIGSPNAMNFENFQVPRDYLPSRKLLSSSHFVGFGHRWMCLQSGRQIEIIDSLTGEPQWSVELQKNFNQMFATDDIVVAAEVSGQEAVCFDRRTGEVVQLDNAAKLANTVIRNAGPLVVAWKSGKDKEPNSLEWLNPVTKQVTNKVSLAGLTAFHFLDDRTLIGINDSSGFMAIDLVDGSSRQFSFADEQRQQSSTVAVDEKQDPAAPLQDIPLWSARRIQVTADHLHYYVSNRPGIRVAPFRQPSGMSALRFEGNLRVIDRQSGKLKYVVKNDGILMASTDHPELGVLVLMQDASRMQPPAMPVGNNGSQNLFRGISKLTGEEVFRQKIPSRFGLRYLQLDSPAPNILDIAVHGMRVRLQGEN